MREQSSRSFHVRSKLITNLAGVAIVLVCIALPLVLEGLSLAMQEEAGNTYIRALNARRALSCQPATIVMNLTQPDASTRLFEQHYYFVNGCVEAPRECISADVSDWGEYYGELRRLYDQAAQNAVYQQSQPFEIWAKEHTHLIMSGLAPVGAARIAQALAENKGRGSIHFIGTSVGGSAIFNYLSQAMRGDIPLDSRIRSVMTVDSPLGRQIRLSWREIMGDLLSGFPASAMKTDVQAGLGKWATMADIAIFTIDTREDIIGYDPLPDITNDSSPHYPQSDTPQVPNSLKCRSLLCQLGNLTEFIDQGSIWHIYTGSHMADSAKQFIDEHWR